MLVVRFVLLLNILINLSPLVRGKDDLSDIPLTPAQRALLGLAPSATPPTSGSQYITPPRYPRSSTPLSTTPNSKYSGSPGSGRPTPNQGSPSKGSPFSPNASPLLHKAMGGVGRRSSYGSPSPLGPGTFGMAPSTPTPSGAGKGSGVGLNNKWLYEKGRRSSGTAHLFS
jgi:nucleoporin POM34